MTATDQYLNFRPVRSEHHSCTPVRAFARFDRSGQAPPQLLRRQQPHLPRDDDQRESQSRSTIGSQQPDPKSPVL